MSDNILRSTCPIDLFHRILRRLAWAANFYHYWFHPFIEMVVLYVGQFSMQFLGGSGSVLSAIQHLEGSAADKAMIVCFRH